MVKKVIINGLSFIIRVLSEILPIEEFGFYSLGANQRAKRLGFGEGTRVYMTSVIYGKPKIGKNVFIGPYAVIDGTGPLVIGDNCQISLHAMIWTHSTHPWCLMGEVAKGRMKIDDVLIENNVWIGAGAIITPGVRIGHHSIIASGAVVTENIPPFSLAAGTPARVIKRVSIINDQVKYMPIEKGSKDIRN